MSSNAAVGLQITPEVAHAICMNSVSSNTLITLARTSRLFSQFACREIWHSLPSFVPLFLTLPEDAYRLERNPMRSTHTGIAGMGPATTLKARRALTPNDLVRLSFYAPFIRRVAYRYDPYAAYEVCDVSIELWNALQAVCPPGLVNLEVLKHSQVAYIDRQAYAHPIHLFAGPSLKRFQFSILYLDERTGRPDRRTTDTTTRDPNLEVFLQRLPQLAPHIENFAFATKVRVFAREALSDALCGLSQLTSVKIDRVPLRPHAVQHLSTLPALHSLKLEMPPEDEPLADTWPAGTPGGFAALRDLGMRALRFDQCIAILNRVSSPVLRSITVEVGESSRTGTFRDLACAISALPSSHSSVRSLAFSARHVESDAALPPEALTPLLTLSALEQLEFSHSLIAVVDDATMCAMAHSWPHIRALTLCPWIRCQPQEHATIQATVHGLRHFAECCPDLERLDISLSHISAATLASSSDLPQLDPSRPHLLERLGLGRPKLHDEAALAAHLSLIFPALMYIEHCWDSEPWNIGETEAQHRIMFDRWNALYGVYQAFVRIRAQEKHWADTQRRLQLASNQLRNLEL